MDEEGPHVELELKRQTLRFERLVAQEEEQVTIEGEATLPGSMRDAVTVLSVQAQAHVTGTQAGNEEAAVRGRVCFQVLYTQGDLTRVRALETACDFEHSVKMDEVAPGMRITAQAGVQQTEGTAASGRMTLRALVGLQIEAFAIEDDTLVTGVSETASDEGSEAEQNQSAGLQTKMQTVRSCITTQLGEEKTLVREEFDLPDKLGAGDVLSATGTATVGEFTGGAGRIGVSGTIEVRVLHRPAENGNPLVMTTHELPFELAVDARVPEGAGIQADAEVIDVLADSGPSDQGRTLRVEAEVAVSLRVCQQMEAELLEDLYSLAGPEAQPVVKTIQVHTFEENAQARESTRVQVTLPQDAPPIDMMLAAFVQPTVVDAQPAGRRLNTEGIMRVTLVYLPVDSDIPVSVQAAEPFSMTFPIETGEGVRAQAYAIEASAGPSTSDRAEVRCVLGLRARRHGTTALNGVTDVQMLPAAQQEHGFVLVWPAAGESRWTTARRLRVAPDSLRPAGKGALLAFRG